MVLFFYGAAVVLQYFLLLLFLVYHLLAVLVAGRAARFERTGFLSVLLVVLTRRACCLLVQVERATANSGAGRRLPKGRRGRVNCSDFFSRLTSLCVQHPTHLPLRRWILPDLARSYINKT